MPGFSTHTPMGPPEVVEGGYNCAPDTASTLISPYRRRQGTGELDHPTEVLRLKGGTVVKSWRWELRWWGWDELPPSPLDAPSSLLLLSSMRPPLRLPLPVSAPLSALLLLLLLLVLLMPLLLLSQESTSPSRRYVLEKGFGPIPRSMCVPTLGADTIAV